VKYLFNGLLPQNSEDNELNIKYTLINKIRRKLSTKLNTLTFHERTLIKYLKKHKVDLVLAEFGMTGTAMMKVCKKLNLPLLVHFHGLDAYLHKILEENKDKYPAMFKQAAVIYVVSNHMYNQLISLGCPPEKLILNPYGPANFFLDIQNAYTTKNLLAIGRFVNKKGPQHTIQAFADTLKQHPDAKLRMVGDGDLLEACKLLAKKLQIENNIEFCGVLAPAAIADLFSTSVAFVQHSLTADNGDTEGTPVAVLEASAAGLPVIATKHAGIPDVIVDGETGFLFEEGDVKAMTTAMIHILDNPELAKRMGQAGRKRIIEKFTLDRHISVINDSFPPMV
jgi:colanic acid/amylovoran biosynthesis glycosyltransferase